VYGTPFLLCHSPLEKTPHKAAVVGNRGPMGTARTLIEMAAQCRGAAARHGQQHFDMPPTNPLVVSLDEGGSRGADEIGNLQQRPGH
jgi:hypothetical protein